MQIEVRQPTPAEKTEAATWSEWGKEPSEFPWSRKNTNSVKNLVFIVN